MRWFHWVFICIALLMLIGIFAEDNTITTTTDLSSVSKTETTQIQIPDDQQLFLDTVTSFTKNFREAKNELSQSTARFKRKEAIARLNLNSTISDWVGTIKNMKTTSGDKAILTVDIGHGIELHTWNNAISDIMDDTLIEPDSPLYQTLANMSKNQKVIFSGNFMLSERDFYNESSLTIDGSMTNPEYVFKFMTIDSVQ